MHINKLILFSFLYFFSLFAVGQKLYYFSGSDWCAPCVKLKKEVLNTKAFNDFLSSSRVALEVVDFPQRQKGISKIQRDYRDSLAKVYNPEGLFPLLVLVKEDSHKGFVVAHQGGFNAIKRAIEGQIQPKFYTYRSNLMESFFELKLNYSDTNLLRETNIFSQQLIQEFSSWDSTSFTSQVNRSAGLQPVSVPPRFLKLVKTTKLIGELTAGAFDITVKPLVNLWDWRVGIVPTDSMVAEKLELIDLNAVRVDSLAGTVYLGKKGMSLDFGGCGKGYLVDEVIAFWKSKGVKNGIVNAGGDLYLLGSKGGEPWTVSIKNPTDSLGFLFNVELENCAVVTSGNYKRFFVDKGIKYNHFISAKTGAPVRNNIASITVFHSSALLADALATAFFVSGENIALQSCKQFNCEVVIVKNNGVVLQSDGIQMLKSDKRN